MADISAKEVLAKLKGFGSDRSPEYGIYLMQVAGKNIKLFDKGGKAVTVRAENIIHYMDKGFTVEDPKPAPNPVSRVAPPAPKEKK